MTTTGATQTPSSARAAAPSGSAPDVIVLPDASPIARNPAAPAAAAPLPAATPRPAPVPAPRTTDARTVRDLVSVAQRDISLLVSKEIELAKAEFQTAVRRGVIGGAGLGAAALFAFFAAIALILTSGFGINAAGVPLWASFGIVTLVLFVVAGIGAALGGMHLLKIRVDPPTSAIAGAKADLATLRGKGKKKA